MSSPARPSAEATNQTGIIFDIKEFAVHDGPGIRTTVFFKGCPLRCWWCHNPEGLDPRPQLMVRAGCTHCGRCRQPCGHTECAPYGRCTQVCPNGLVNVCGYTVDAETLTARLLKNRPFWEDGGGVTFSGGEPLMQAPFLFEMLERLQGVDTVIETSGYAPEVVFGKAVMLADRIYLDIKHMDDEAHRKGTGVSNRPIQRNLDILMASGKPFVVRSPVIPGFNDSPEQRRAIEKRVTNCSTLEKLEFLPYNTLAAAKYEQLGLSFGKRLTTYDEANTER